MLTEFKEFTARNLEFSAFLFIAKTELGSMHYEILPYILHLCVKVQIRD